MTLHNLKILLARELEQNHYVSDVLDALFSVVDEQSRREDERADDNIGAEHSGARVNADVFRDVATALDQARHDARSAEIELGADEIDSLTRGAL